MWSVQVEPRAAGHVTGIDVNMGDFVLHPALLHFAVASVLLITKVVVTRVSLLMIVWAFSVIVVHITAAAKTPAVSGKRCGFLIFIIPCPV
jgi:hypothetical protein